jgi:hypothetical protein
VFDGFETNVIEVADAAIFVRHGGTGPPVLLLHGHPRTSGPASPSTAGTRRPTWRPAYRLKAPPWSCGRSTTTWRISTVIR